MRKRIENHACMLRMIFGTGHKAYHWGALLECGTRVPLLIKATRVAESYRDFVIGYQGLM